MTPDNYTGTVKDKYTAKEWANIEKKGLVALPCTGRFVISFTPVDCVHDHNVKGYYYTATSSKKEKFDNAIYDIHDAIIFDDNTFHTERGSYIDDPIYESYCLRLVKTL